MSEPVPSPAVPGPATGQQGPERTPAESGEPTQRTRPRRRRPRRRRPESTQGTPGTAGAGRDGETIAETAGTETSGPAAAHSADSARDAARSDTPLPTPGELRARIELLGTADRPRLERRLSGLRKSRDEADRRRTTAQILAAVETAEQKLARRAAAVPVLKFPEELPVSDKVDEIAATIRDHQVVVVAGETGSGKSTQLPKICLQIGRGVKGLIGHTQPRRIAARALAERIAEETGTQVGGAVGYSIRFGDHTGPDTLVKLMTDGILLAEINRDRLLTAYDTIIIDEAHERSLNIDFLLGYLTEILPRRPDLKVIITSATIDVDRFSRHFATAGVPAPVVEVSGRTYPVEVRYRPCGPEESGEDEFDEPTSARPTGKRDDTESKDQAQAICDAVDELSAEGDGDILVFLSGEREITDTAEVLRGHLQYRPGTTEVLPLYGRLSAADQHRVFSPHTGRRIVLSTNVAETSLTVPGIRYVIDPGTARISRYSTRTKVQRLPIEPISQASANQRAGRCGRVADGICIRLYSEEDFLGRPEFTDPEVARTSLASVILQMAALDLGDIASFPFLEPPDSRQISDGIGVLTELGAILREDGRTRLTPTGRSIAALPVDPRLARMLVEGDRRNVLPEMLVIVSALAIQDVREYPLEERDKATAAHSRFVDPKSDFLATLHLWHYLRTEAKARSGNAFRRMCKQEYLHYLRIREWQDLHAQLRQIARQLGLRGMQEGEQAAPTERPGKEPATQQGRGTLATTPVDSRAVHIALISGLLSHIGLKSEAGREFQGARGTAFLLWPGSALAKSPPKLVVAAELVETSRLWGRTAAAVDPLWVEEVGGDLLRRSYSEPRWDARRGSVVATEKVTLLGVTLIGARTVQFDHVDPSLARELFIRHALVEGDWQTRHAFFAANKAAMEEVSEREDRVRRRDLLLDDESLFALYDARIPASVTSARHFDAWWKKASRTDPGLLTFTPEMLLSAGAVDVDPEAFPDTFTSGGVDLDLDYVYDPARTDDGVSVTIPLAVLARVDPAAFERQIPGLRKDLAVALLRSLPKTLRRNFVPAPDFAAAALARAGDGPLPVELAGALTALTGIVVTPGDFDLEKVPAHLRMTFRVVDPAGAQIAAGKDLDQLQAALRADTRKAVATVSASQVHGARERSGLTVFPEEGIPQQVRSVVAGQEILGYPALVDDGASAGLRVFTSEEDQLRAMRRGTIRLLALRIKPPVAHVRNGLTKAQQLTLTVTPHGDLGVLLADATTAAIDALFDWAGGPAWDVTGFERLVTRLTPQVPKAVLDVVIAAEAVLRAAHEAETAIDAVAASPGAGGLRDRIGDLREQLVRLLPPGFLTRTGAAHLPDLTRWLQALAVRASRVREAPDRDRLRSAEIDGLQRDLDDVTTALDVAAAGRSGDPDVREVARMLDEFRVATFAQPMRTAVPVSAKRVHAAIAALR
ncbi:ATP-dependent RNA helicase HrpA [Nakamurella sp. YIM 132087]|uniref:RNA helicase n=1 Tax=Nakamurella alba TaxID=2665158 RepID=A0A7K1FMY9_9ACTN|nr:ATP-dependent RNA helicase HrpA [Nakamurella alba]MTD15450.1 ATP-dependent RNA helicase HrpA [Nakamurella alba]